MPLTGRSEDQRGGDHRVNREPVVRGLAFQVIFQQHSLLFVNQTSQSSSVFTQRTGH